MIISIFKLKEKLFTFLILHFFLLLLSSFFFLFNQAAWHCVSYSLVNINTNTNPHYA